MGLEGGALRTASFPALTREVSVFSHKPPGTARAGEAEKVEAQLQEKLRGSRVQSGLAGCVWPTPSHFTSRACQELLFHGGEGLEVRLH